MRRPWLSWAFVALVLGLAVFTGPVHGHEDADEIEELDDTPVETVFNDQTVPPMEMLTTANIKDRLKTGHWLVEFFSPYCPHCIAFAPEYQTLYEFYYTSRPLAASSTSKNDALNSFTGYYNFAFAKVDCTSNGDACKEFDIKSFPTIKLFRDGVAVPDKLITGHQALNTYTDLIESTLESIKPGSRLPAGPRLPKPGSKHSPDYAGEADSAKSSSTSATTTTASPAAAEASSAAALAIMSAVKGVEPAPTAPAANPNGLSINLSESTFDSLVSGSQDGWFVKFYAPWCSHCQVLAPHWDEMAARMKGKLNVAEVNCDAEPGLCKAADVRSFPTIRLYRGSHFVPYQAGRKTDDLVGYASDVAAVNTGIADVDAAGLARLMDQNDVVFVYFYDSATTSEDLAVLDKLLLDVVGHGRLVKTADKKAAKQFGVESWPRLAVSRSKRVMVNPASTPSEIRDGDGLSTWVRSVRLPLLAELTAGNVGDIMKNNIVVLAVIPTDHFSAASAAKDDMAGLASRWAEVEDRLNDENRNRLRLEKVNKINEATGRADWDAVRDATQVKIDRPTYTNRPVQFAWVDGVFWSRWIENTYGISLRGQEVAVVINDELNHQFWDRDRSSHLLSVSQVSLFETLPLVITPRPQLPSRSTRSGLMALLANIRSKVDEKPMFSCLVVSATGLVLVIFIRRLRRRHQLSHHHHHSHARARNSGHHANPVIPFFDPEAGKRVSTNGKMD